MKFKNRDEFISNLNNLTNSEKGVEIGVFRGHLSKKILQNWSGTLYMVDVWRVQGSEYEDLGNTVNHTEIINECIENIKGYEDRGIMLRASSKKAAESFNDNSLDFIYIDANHAYDFVKQDLELWFPKLKKGGIFSGHDYLGIDWYNDPNFADNKKDKFIYNMDGLYLGLFGVNPAVDEFCLDKGYQINLTSEWYGTWWFKK